MSRFMLVASLVFGLSSAADASAHFAQPPSAQSPSAEPPSAEPQSAPDTSVSNSDVFAPPTAGARIIAPRRILDRASVRAALARARALNLAAFRAYQKQGVFPSNTFKPGKLNVWLDADGHFCAAATIIKMSGQLALVTKVAEQNNFIRLADVKQGPLMDWILTSGLTQGEIAAIQRPFSPVVEHPQLAPEQPLVVDAKLRKAEDARLRALYRTIDRMLVKNQAKSLDLATDRLMKQPALAWQLVDARDITLE